MKNEVRYVLLLVLIDNLMRLEMMFYLHKCTVLKTSIEYD